jgi:FMN hydrolase / 5-amino-6-(5-phospho-D-ribitylamino)uracil phosphatase
MDVSVDMKVITQFEGVECVTLDLDDTLWPVEPTIERAELKLYQWVEKNYPQVSNAYTQQDIAAKRMELKLSRADIAHNVTELRYCSLLEIADEFGYGNAFAQEALELFRYYRNQVEPYEFSESILAILKQHFIVGAITNGNAQLDQIPIGEYFDFVVTAEEMGVCKPHPNMFERASRLANVELANVMHVGDSAQTDVLGAMNAGCKAVWLNSKRQPWPGGQNPHHVVHSLTELPAILNIK